MLALCAERDGLVVSLSRIVAADRQPDLAERTRATASVFGRLLEATRPGATGARALRASPRDAYAAAGFPGEELKHHQGGAIGYRAREWVAHPKSQEVVQAAPGVRLEPDDHRHQGRRHGAGRRRRHRDADDDARTGRRSSSAGKSARPTYGADLERCLRGPAAPPPARRTPHARPRTPPSAVARHIEAGGITRFLYGGNAFLYHASLDEFATLIDWLVGLPGQPLADSEHRPVVRPRDRPGAAAADAQLPRRDDAAVRRPARRRAVSRPACAKSPTPRRCRSSCI